ncbi:hypothetical protein ACIG5E_31505 [Kitasatospora sp. NPDC053057]|uniref:hypothetical protein n=1 Tax=Kitasatospora sp. NPDC053057 TaxID=3364062 RepID=UPI0037C9826A
METGIATPTVLPSAGLKVSICIGEADGDGLALELALAEAVAPVPAEAVEVVPSAGAEWTAEADAAPLHPLTLASTPPARTAIPMLFLIRPMTLAPLTPIHQTLRYPHRPRIRVHGCVNR